MIIENFICDKKKQSISWKYSGTVIYKTIENVFFANVNKEKKYIYVEAGKNFLQEYIYHLSYDGEIIFKLDKLRDEITWLYKNKHYRIISRGVEDAQIYDEIILILCELQPDKYNTKLVGLSLEGTVIFENIPPEGYNFVRVSSIGNKPCVVCDGKEDKYGRNMRNFLIDAKNGKMVKENLAY